MSKKIEKLRVGFLGRGNLGREVLEGLLNNPNVVVPIIVNCDPSAEVGEGRCSFERVAKKHDIPFYFTNDVNNEEWISRMAVLNLDLAVAMLWLYTLRAPILSTAKLGFLNLHGGMLPRYRGNACSNWAILNEETEHGLTVHFMEANKLDSGPIVIQEPIPINDGSTIKELMDHIMSRGAELVLQAVDKIFKDDLEVILQDESSALRCYPRLPRDGEINWHKNAADIERLVRATGDPYPGAYSFFADVRDGNNIKKLNVDKCHIENHIANFYAVPGHVLKLEDGKKWAVVTGDMKLIILDEIRIDGQRVQPEKFFRTVRQRLGIDTETLINEIRKIKSDVGLK